MMLAECCPGAGTSADGSRVPLAYLGAYLFLNSALTLFNKLLLRQIAFPYLLTAVHTGASYAGTLALRWGGYFDCSILRPADHIKLGLFSVLYTVNIAVSNISLNLVTVPFHQVIRATTPAFTVLIYALIWHKTYATATYLSLVPVIAGVGLATYGDYSASLIGFLLTLSGAFLAAVKTVATNTMQTGGMRLGALELLHCVSPLAALQSLVCAYTVGEFGALQRIVALKPDGMYNLIMISALNALTAFALNVVSFQANNRYGALTMSVAANIKQILVMSSSWIIFDLDFGLAQLTGILTTLVGGWWYAKLEHSDQRTHCSGTGVMKSVTAADNESPC